MNIGSIIPTSVLFSTPVQVLSKISPFTSSFIPFSIVTRGEKSWGNVLKVSLATGLAINELAPQDALPIHSKDRQIIHTCHQILITTLFIKAVLQVYQTRTWDSAKALIPYVPLCASMATKTHPIFQMISEVPPKEVEQTHTFRSPKPFALVLNDKITYEKALNYIHRFNPKNKNGERPYKIFTLSLGRLIGCGSFWVQRAYEIFDYLKAQGPVILIIPEMELATSLTTGNDYSFLKNFIRSREVIAGIQVIGLTSSFVKIQRDIQVYDIDKRPKLPPPIPNGIAYISPEEAPHFFDFHKAQAFSILETLGNPRKHQVFLIGNEEEEKGLLLETVGYLLKTAKPPLENHQLLTVYYPALFGPDGDPQNEIFAHFKPGTILYIKGTEFAHISSLKIILNIPLKLIVSLTSEQFSAIKSQAPSIERTFVSHTIPSLPEEIQTDLFAKQLAKHPDLELSEDLRDKILRITGPCPISEQLDVLERVVSIMTQREYAEEEALAVIKSEVAKQSKVSLPDHLIELTNSSQEVICLERAHEMEEILITLYSEDGKNNVCLVGEAGCGKTQLVRYIASQIQKGAIPQFQGYRVFNFAISAIIADSTYIGQWQGKLKRILDYCSRVGKAIVFIDEIHLAIGTGKTKGGTSMDVAQMMKEYITSPHLRVIGATTPEEYDQYFTADRAFADRFKRLDLPPLPRDKQLAALMAHSEKHRRDHDPLEERVLERILDSAKSLRTSIGTVAEVHAFMRYHQTSDVERALSWIHGEDPIL
ncbi:MAG: AAA family ATPase [Chlamydiales bacterium]|nr:AAA family ATPase [Chlamydiales bacterium]